MATDDVARVLTREMKYDDLEDPVDRAVVRKEWSRRILEDLATLDVAGELLAAGHSVSSWDEVRQAVMIIHPDGTREYPNLRAGLLEGRM